MVKGTPIMLDDKDREFLDSCINATKTHLKSRSAIVRHLIAKAKKKKDLLK